MQKDIPFPSWEMTDLEHRKTSRTLAGHKAFDGKLDVTN